MATVDISRISEMDAIILCLPTPLGIHNEPDMSFLIDAIENILPYLRKGQLVSLESTTYPGTTEEVISPRVGEAGYVIGTEIFIAYSPERVDTGNAVFTVHSTPKIIGGITERCLEIGCALYGSVIETIIPVSSTKVAEMTKLLENVFRAVNIGLVNELKIAANKMGIDIWEAIEAASTKPFGFMPFYPGPGLGGHCIPIDPYYLKWKAREYGVYTRFIELAGEINTSMPQWIISKVQDGLNMQKKSVNGSTILVLGIAYKKNVSDISESPSLQILRLLIEKGAKVDYSDRYIPCLERKRKHEFNITSVSLTIDAIKSYDCVIIATDHDYYDYEMIQAHAKLVVDSRGRYKEKCHNIIKA